jgi:hypothetical protein
MQWMVEIRGSMPETYRNRTVCQQTIRDELEQALGVALTLLLDELLAAQRDVPGVRIAYLEILTCPSWPPPLSDSCSKPSSSE